MLPGILEWREIMLALMRISTIPIPATALLTSKDIEYRLASADIKAFLHQMKIRIKWKSQ